MKTFPLHLTDEQHKDLQSRAVILGLSLNKLIMNKLFSRDILSEIPPSSEPPGTLWKPTCALCGEITDCRYQYDGEKGEDKAVCYECVRKKYGKISETVWKTLKTSL